MYIIRPSDDEVFDLLSRGEYCNVLCSRQMGKTSLLMRAKRRLAEFGVKTASIDVAGFLGVPANGQTWYVGLLQEVADRLELDVDVSGWWHACQAVTANQRLIRFFRNEVAARIDAAIVIILDEIDSTLSLPYTDEFFVALCAMYNDRQCEPAFESLSFCLVGVATPNELIKDHHTTPYNVGRTIELGFDPARDDLGPLHQAVSADPRKSAVLVEEVLRWTDGQPYLTVKLCDELVPAQATKLEDVTRLVESSFQDFEAVVRSDVHFEWISRMFAPKVPRVVSLEKALSLYRAIWQGKQELDKPTPAHMLLKLSGLVKRNREGSLVVRNHIYQKVFNYKWIKLAFRPKPNNLPFASLGSLFKGREAFLDDLRARLGVPGGRGPRPSSTRLAVHGLGGVGKTRAAIEYAWRHAGDYTALLFVSAPSPSELRADLADLAGVLGSHRRDRPSSQRLAEVLRWLDDHPGWLLIVDNVDTREAAREVQNAARPARAGHVLITSRIANWRAGVEPLELHLLAEADAVDLPAGAHAPPPPPGPTTPRPPRPSPASWTAGPGAGAGRGVHRQAAALASPSTSSAGRRSAPRSSAGTTSG